MANAFGTVLQLFKLQPIPLIDDMRVVTVYYKRSTKEGGIEVVSDVDDAALLSPQLAERITERLSADAKFKSEYYTLKSGECFKTFETPCDESLILRKLDQVGEILPPKAAKK